VCTACGGHRKADAWAYVQPGEGTGKQRRLRVCRMLAIHASIHEGGHSYSMPGAKEAKVLAHLTSVCPDQPAAAAALAAAAAAPGAGAVGGSLCQMWSWRCPGTSQRRLQAWARFAAQAPWLQLCALGWCRVKAPTRLKGRPWRSKAPSHGQCKPCVCLANMGVCVRVCVCECVRTLPCVCVRAHVRVRVRARTCVRVHVCLPACEHAFLWMQIPWKVNLGAIAPSWHLSGDGTHSKHTQTAMCFEGPHTTMCARTHIQYTHKCTQAKLPLGLHIPPTWAPKRRALPHLLICASLAARARAAARTCLKPFLQGG